MNGLNFDLAALSFAAFISALSYLVIKFWHLAHPKRPYDWAIDAPELAWPKECHLKVLK